MASCALLLSGCAFLDTVAVFQEQPVPTSPSSRHDKDVHPRGGTVPVASDLLPDQIIRQPRLNDYAQARVGVLVFESPDYAENQGSLAAELLFNALLQRNLYAELTLIQTMGAPGLEQTLFEFVQAKQLDLLVTGEVSYYLEGGNFQASRVCESLRVLEPSAHDSLQRVWQAKSCQSSAARAAHDLLLFRTPGKPAAPCVELMRGIAGQFAAMLEFVPERTPRKPEEAGKQ